MAVAAKGCGERFTRFSPNVPRSIRPTSGKLACPSYHVDTRDVGPVYVAAVSGRVAQDTGEDLDRLLDERRAGRVDVIDPGRERRPAGRGEVDQEAARVRPDRFLPGGAFLEQEVECRGVHFAKSFAPCRTSSRIASSKSSPPRRRMPSLVTTSLQRPGHLQKRGVKRAAAEVVDHDVLALSGEGRPVPMGILEARRGRLI